MSTFVCPAEIPELTRPPKETARDATSVSLQWRRWRKPRDKGDGPVTSYLIYYAILIEPLQFTSSRARGTRGKISGLEPDTLYQFMIVPVHESGVVGHGSPAINVSTCGGKNDFLPNVTCCSSELWAGTKSTSSACWMTLPRGLVHHHNHHGAVVSWVANNKHWFQSWSTEVSSCNFAAPQTGPTDVHLEETNPKMEGGRQTSVQLKVTWKVTELVFQIHKKYSAYRMSPVKSTTQSFACCPQAPSAEESNCDSITEFRIYMRPPGEEDFDFLGVESSTTRTIQNIDPSFNYTLGISSVNNAGLESRRTEVTYIGSKGLKVPHKVAKLKANQNWVQNFQCSVVESWRKQTPGSWLREAGVWCFSWHLH